MSFLHFRFAKPLCRRSRCARFHASIAGVQALASLGRHSGLRGSHKFIYRLCIPPSSRASVPIASTRALRIIVSGRAQHHRNHSVPSSFPFRSVHSLPFLSVHSLSVSFLLLPFSFPCPFPSATTHTALLPALGPLLPVLFVLRLRPLLRRARAKCSAARTRSAVTRTGSATTRTTRTITIAATNTTCANTCTTRPGR